MNPVDNGSIAELARRAARLIQTQPLGDPVRGKWIREVELGPYRIVMEEPIALFSKTTLEVCKGSNIIYTESYTLPRGPKEAAEALKFLRQNMALEDLADIE